MVINQQIKQILRDNNIDVDKGLLALLGIYFGVDIDKVYDEETINAINLTKIVDKDYANGTLNWNVPLFGGQEIAFEWVNDWIQPFGKLNPDRKGSFRECLPRMKRLFAENPTVRKTDVYLARDEYLKTVSSPTYLKSPHKFIAEGIGSMKTSELMKWIDKITSKDSGKSDYQRGEVKQ